MGYLKFIVACLLFAFGGLSSFANTSKHWDSIQSKADELKLAIPEDCLYVSVDEQQMYHYKNGKLYGKYTISTAKNGVNCKEGSFGTPKGMHRVREKFGSKQPIGMVFKARQATGKTYFEVDKLLMNKDLVTSRILWIEGLEKGLNAGGQVDSYRRYIYIHGTNHEDKLGSPVSMGCIRMKNSEVIALFDKVRLNSLVLIGS